MKKETEYDVIIEQLAEIKRGKVPSDAKEVKALTSKLDGLDELDKLKREEAK